MLSGRVERFWRMLATGFCFVVFGIGGLVLTLLVLPVILLTARDRRRGKARVRTLIHHCFRGFVALMVWLGTIEVAVTGKEILATDRGKLIIANHPSLIDVVILISLIPNADCIVKEALWHNFFIRGVVGAAYISNSDPELLMEACADSLAEGNNLIIFPEGTRTRTDVDLNSFQRGAANIALRAAVDIRPVVVNCEPPFLTKTMSWYEMPEKRARFTLRVQEPVTIEKWLTKPDSVTLEARQLTKILESQYRESLAYE